MTDLREVVARALLDRRGFGFYTDPMEGGQDAYDITNEALAEADAVLAALAGRIAPEVDSGVVRAAIDAALYEAGPLDGSAVIKAVHIAAPIIAAATEAKVREECAKIALSHRRGESIVADLIAAAIRTGVASVYLSKQDQRVFHEALFASTTVKSRGFRK